MSYIFLDESGDLGFDPEKNNSKFFIVTFIFMENKKPIEKVVKKVHAGLRKKEIRLSGGVLHCYKEKPATRIKLLKLLGEKEYNIMVIYLNKDKVYSKLREEKHILYNYVVNILLDRIMTKKFVDKNKKIFLVASKRETNKFLNDNFRSYLQKQLEDNHKLKIDIDIQTPAKEKSLQAVDFVSWGIFRKYEKGEDTYYNLIKEKVLEENALFK